MFSEFRKRGSDPCKLGLSKTAKDGLPPANKAVSQRLGLGFLYYDAFRVAIDERGSL